MIASEGLEIIDPEGVSHSFDPDNWVSEMDSTQVALPEGSEKLQGVPVWKIVEQHSAAQIPGQVSFSSESDQVSLAWAEIDGKDDLRIFTVIEENGIQFALATMSGEVRLFPLNAIEVQP